MHLLLVWVCAWYVFLFQGSCHKFWFMENWRLHERSNEIMVHLQVLKLNQDSICCGTEYFGRESQEGTCQLKEKIQQWWDVTMIMGWCNDDGIIRWLWYGMNENDNNGIWDGTMMMTCYDGDDGMLQWWWWWWDDTMMMMMGWYDDDDGMVMMMTMMG